MYGDKRKGGYFGVVKYGGVPIFLHWSLPAGGVFLAFFLGDNSLETQLGLITAYTLLVTLHEFGHAFAGRKADMKIEGVYINAIGGHCAARYHEYLISYRELMLFYSGGLLVQLAALASCIFYIAVFGAPESVLGNCFVFVLTFVNGFVALINLLPFKGSDGYQLLKTHGEWRDAA